MKEVLSPMADSTFLNDIAAVQSQRDDTLAKALRTIAENDIFCDALNEYILAGIEMDVLHDDQTALLPIASFVNWTARQMVIAAADHHCAKAVFIAHKALNADDTESEEA